MAVENNGSPRRGATGFSEEYGAKSGETMGLWLSNFGTAHPVVEFYTNQIVFFELTNMEE